METHTNGGNVGALPGRVACKWSSTCISFDPITLPLDRYPKDIVLHSASGEIYIFIYNSKSKTNWKNLNPKYPSTGEKVNAFQYMYIIEHNEAIKMH